MTSRSSALQFVNKEIDISSRTMKRDSIRCPDRDSCLEADEMTRKTKCKLLFFSVWSGCTIWRAIYRGFVWYATIHTSRWHLQLFSYILFAHRKRHEDTFSEKFVLSVEWRFGTGAEHRAKKSLISLILYVLQTFFSTFS